MDDDRRRATYFAILAGLLIAIGAALGWAAHVAWIDRGESVQRFTAAQVLWHGVKAVLPFVLLFLGLWIVPRRSAPLQALCVAAAVVTATGLVVYGREALRYSAAAPPARETPPPDTPFRELPQVPATLRPQPLDMHRPHEALAYWQFWTAALGVLAAAGIARQQDPRAGRP